MDTTEIKGNLNDWKGRLKQQFAVLTHTDLMLSEEKKEEMFERLQVKLGKTKEEVHKIITDL